MLTYIQMHVGVCVHAYAYVCVHTCDSLAIWYQNWDFFFCHLRVHCKFLLWNGTFRGILYIKHIIVYIINYVYIKFYKCMLITFCILVKGT